MYGSTLSLTFRIIPPLAIVATYRYYFVVTFQHKLFKACEGVNFIIFSLNISIVELTHSEERLRRGIAELGKGALRYSKGLDSVYNIAKPRIAIGDLVEPIERRIISTKRLSEDIGAALRKLKTAEPAGPKLEVRVKAADLDKMLSKVYSIHSPAGTAEKLYFKEVDNYIAAMQRKEVQGFTAEYTKALAALNKIGKIVLWDTVFVERLAEWEKSPLSAATGLDVGFEYKRMLDEELRQGRPQEAHLTPRIKRYVLSFHVPRYILLLELGGRAKEARGLLKRAVQDKASAGAELWERTTLVSDVLVPAEVFASALISELDAKKTIVKEELLGKRLPKYEVPSFDYVDLGAQAVLRKAKKEIAINEKTTKAAQRALEDSSPKESVEEYAAALHTFELTHAMTLRILEGIAGLEKNLKGLEEWMLKENLEEFLPLYSCQPPDLRLAIKTLRELRVKDGRKTDSFVALEGLVKRG